MAYKLDFHPEAEGELDEAVSWYKEQQDGLEQVFFDDYLALEKRLEDTPQQFPVVFEDVRRANFSQVSILHLFCHRAGFRFYLRYFPPEKESQRVGKTALIAPSDSRCAKCFQKKAAQRGVPLLRGFFLETYMSLSNGASWPQSRR